MRCARWPTRTRARGEARAQGHRRRGLQRRHRTTSPRYVKKARAAQADAWIAFGDARDAAEMLRTFRQLGYAPRLFFARSARDPRLINLVGQDAEFSLGASSTTRSSGRRERAVRGATPQGGPRRRTCGAPRAMRQARCSRRRCARAGSLDQEKLRSTLAQLEIDTVLGGYQVDPESGEQPARGRRWCRSGAASPWWSGRAAAGRSSRIRSGTSARC